MNEVMILYISGAWNLIVFLLLGYILYSSFLFVRKNGFGFLKLKKIYIPLILISIITVGHIGASKYESYNNCTIQFNINPSFSNIPPFVCQGNNHFDIYNFDYGINCENAVCPGKPLILLYPQKDTQVKVKLEYHNKFSATFPKYQDQISGWTVIAHPDGTLYDISSSQYTYGLFWEGNPSNTHFDMLQGFVVPGSEVREFLYAKLTEIGLNTKERSDFIMYWYPLLQNYRYVQITFAGTDYTDTAKLEISPRPDSLLRVFMVARPLDTYIQIPEQKFDKFERKGFSVVEWGGTIISDKYIK